MRASRAFPIDSAHLGLPSFTPRAQGTQRSCCSVGDRPCFVFGEGSHDMHGEPICLRHVGRNEIDAGLHQPGNEVHIARQAVELGDQQCSRALLRLLNGGEQLGPIAGAALLCGLDLSEFGQHGRGLGDSSYCFTLGFQTEAALALFVGRNAVVSDIARLFSVFITPFSSDTFRHALQ
jgi:hypothetical protein